MAKSLGEEQVEISDLGQSTQGARGRVRNNTLTLRSPNQSSTPRTDQQFLLLLGCHLMSTLGLGTFDDAFLFGKGEKER